MDNRPIGIFDSGVGGLTVLKEIMALLPGESIIYFGDCGRAPYGIKSKETIVEYTLQNARFLLNHDVKMMVIACNTASAYGYEAVKQNFNIPVIEVIGPGAAMVASKTRNKRVGVIGTPATIRSGVYERTIRQWDASIHIISKACPLFVSLVEEGWWENDIALRIAEEYLTPLKRDGIDTLVLGCTHYPMLMNTISRVMGEDVLLVSSATEIVKAVRDVIVKENMARDARLKPVYQYYTSDSVEKFECLGSAILGREIRMATQSIRW